MRRIAITLFAIGSLASAGQALAWGGSRGYYHGGGHRHHHYHKGSNSGNVAGALIGGAILGVVAGTLISNANADRRTTVIEEAPAMAPPGACYDQYRGVYVACQAAPVVSSYGYELPPASYSEPGLQRAYPQPSTEYGNTGQYPYGNSAQASNHGQYGYAQQQQQYGQQPYGQVPGTFQEPLQHAVVPPRPTVLPAYAGHEGPVGDRYDGPVDNRY